VLWIVLSKHVFAHCSYLRLSCLRYSWTWAIFCFWNVTSNDKIRNCHWNGNWYSEDMKRYKLRHYNHKDGRPWRNLEWDFFGCRPVVSSFVAACNFRSVTNSLGIVHVYSATQHFMSKITWNEITIIAVIIPSAL